MKPIVWVLYDKEKIGSKHQCIGLAEALEVDYIPKAICPAFPWSHLPPFLWYNALHSQREEEDLLLPPYPNLIITSGRASVAVALALKKKQLAQKQKCCVIQILDPRVALNQFDVVIAPEHDNLTGSNIIETKGVIHHLTQVLIETQASLLSFNLAKPYLGVLLGGNSRHITYDDKILSQITILLNQWYASTQGSLIITPSRRTPLLFIEQLKKNLFHAPFFLWDGTLPNPYPGILECADSLLVTGDSISMISEALYVGKPTGVIDIGLNKKKFRKFMKNLENNHYITILDNTLHFKEGKILDERTRILEKLKQKIKIFWYS